MALSFTAGIVVEIILTSVGYGDQLEKSLDIFFSLASKYVG